LWANIAARKDTTEAAAGQRAALREAIAFKAYEFNAHGVDLNQRYTSEAVVPDGTPDPGFTRDPELHHQPSSCPGAKLPHAWITSGTRTLSTLDTVGKGRFTLLTGIGGERWLRAAEAQPLDIATVVIGPGREFEDPYGDWAGLSEISDAGALLVRPDGYVAFRHADAAVDAERLLTDVVRRILGHG
jgi:2,4-dichlorophenol 6-monooxygenase